MTDNTSAPNYEALIGQYESGVGNPNAGDPAEWLAVRSQIEMGGDDLTKEQLNRIEKADRALIAKAEAVVSTMEARGTQLSEARAGRPSGEWWWYLDVLDPVSDYYQAKPKSGASQLFEIGFTVLQVVVLGVALFLIGRNLNIIPLPATPTRTPIPTSAPLPTATINAAALDFTTAVEFKTAGNVIAGKVPNGWTQQPGTSEREFTLTYGDPNNPSVAIQIAVDSAEALYAILDLPAPQTPASPKDALEQFKTVNSDPSAQSPFVFGQVGESAIGNLQGFMLPFTAPANVQTGQSGAVLDLRYAIAQGGKLARLIVQADDAMYPTLQPVIDQIIASLIISAQNIPTATPTATLHPLLMTATAVQTQIFGLTPTFTPTPTLTPTLVGTAPATGEATSAATSAATAEATSAATAEAPAAPTAEATAAATP